MARAGFWIRVAAALIDAVFMAIPIVVIYLGIAYAMGGFEDEVPPEKEARIERIAETVVALLALAYTSLEIWKAATPGKMLLKLQIRSPDATPAPLGNLASRWATKQSPQIIGLFAVLFASRTLEWIEIAALLVVLLVASWSSANPAVPGTTTCPPPPSSAPARKSPSASSPS